ncbi:MAG: XRE family transcriptional regulator [Croceicoccus sp.]|nr:XRE family transcriptional regulator [Croceicoccus sp.]
MDRPQRIFAGKTLRALRSRRGMRQAEMAGTLGISVSYLSQLESDDRPLTPPLIAALTRHFDLRLDDLGGDSSDKRAEALRRAASDPIFAEPLGEDAAARAVRQQPHLADRFVALHTAYRQAGERLQMLDEALESGEPAQSGRLPWEEVRDWFHGAGNYIDTLDRGAEALAARIAGDAPSPVEAALAGFAEGLGLTIREGEAGLRHYDPARRELTLDPAQPAETRRFQLAWQLAGIALADEIAFVTDRSGLASPGARQLLRIGLGNYAAGALLMPYERFRAAALVERHDIDRLRQRFAVSFEQACHRLSTLQRDGARGIPFFFCRVDMAGNITKRHSATPLQFARFGGACPLWIVHEAVAIPDRILTQLAETPDGGRYVSMAKGLVKPSGSYARPPRRYAVALGCEAKDAADFIYADGLDVAAKGAATPIGISCRLCPRENCDQRAFPPGDRAIVVDPGGRGVVPYRFG